MRFSGCRARRGLIVLLALPAAAVLVPAAPAQAGGFDKREVKLERKRAYDVGVNDYNRDGKLDLFSTNHMFRDSLLRGDGKGGYTDVYNSAGFAPNPKLPGVENTTQSPKLSEPGLYTWLAGGGRRPVIRLATHRLREIGAEVGKKVTGRVIVVFPKVRVIRARNAKIRVVRKSRTRTVIHFELRRNASVSMRSNHLDLPIRTRVDAPLSAGQIHVGPRAVAPPKPDFTIRLGDRHGAAWADFDRDGLIDAVVTSGGLSGKSKAVPRFGRDELLLGGKDGFEDAGDGSGLRKGICRGREASAADYNRDGVLDLFLGCRKGRPRLYRGRGDGTFKERRGALKTLGNRGTAHRWIDLDNDGHPELVQGGKFHVRTYKVGRSGKARRRQDIDTPNDDKNVEAIAPGDFDNDGDLDIFIAAPSGNSLLVNRGGRLSRLDPERLGLPGGFGAGAAWVDYDNDSRLDLYASPGGLFRNVGGRFRRARMLNTGQRSRFTRATFFDSDSDGRRDLLRTTERGRSLFAEIKLFQNRTAARKHWLQFDLVGSRGNRQAIGARVQARVGGRTLTQWVGQNEGSRYSQGHYRLYFGLGNRRSARRVKVIWPDGKRSRLGTIAADRLKTVRR